MLQAMTRQDDRSIPLDRVELPSIVESLQGEGESLASKHGPSCASCIQFMTCMLSIYQTYFVTAGSE